MQVNIFELFDWRVLLLCAIGTSFIVSALNEFAPENVRSRYWILTVSIVVVFLNTTFTPKATFAMWQSIGFNFIINVSIAILFYFALGKRFVDKFFSWISKQIDDKLGNGTSPPAVP